MVFIKKKKLWMVRTVGTYVRSLRLTPQRALMCTVLSFFSFANIFPSTRPHKIEKNRTTLLPIHAAGR